MPIVSGCDPHSLACASCLLPPSPLPSRCLLHTGSGLDLTVHVSSMFVFCPCWGILVTFGGVLLSLGGEMKVL